jgi:hypothetical protein
MSLCAPLDSIQQYQNRQPYSLECRECKAMQQLFTPFGTNNGLMATNIYRQVSWNIGIFLIDSDAVCVANLKKVVYFTKIKCQI